MMGCAKGCVDILLLSSVLLYIFSCVYICVTVLPYCCALVCVCALDSTLFANLKGVAAERGVGSEARVRC